MSKLAYSRDGHNYVINQVASDDEITRIFNELAAAYGIPATSAEYLYHYGFGQSVQDAMAQPSAAAKAETMAKVEKGEADLADVESAQIAARVGAANKRVDALLDGSIATRGTGESREPLKSIALEWLRNAAKKKGKKLGSDKDAIAKLVNDLVEKRRADLQAEYDRRKSTTVEVELD